MSLDHKHSGNLNQESLKPCILQFARFKILMILGSMFKLFRALCFFKSPEILYPSGKLILLRWDYFLHIIVSFVCIVQNSLRVTGWKRGVNFNITSAWPYWDWVYGGFIQKLNVLYFSNQRWSFFFDCLANTLSKMKYFLLLILWKSVYFKSSWFFNSEKSVMESVVDFISDVVPQVKFRSNPDTKKLVYLSILLISYPNDKQKTCWSISLYQGPN